MAWSDAARKAAAEARRRNAQIQLRGIHRRVRAVQVFETTGDSRSFERLKTPLTFSVDATKSKRDMLKQLRAGRRLLRNYKKGH